MLNFTTSNITVVEKSHLALRVPEGYITESLAAKTPFVSVYDLWTRSTEIHPSIDDVMTANYSSRSGDIRTIFKSALVECSWDKVTQVGSRILCMLKFCCNLLDHLKGDMIMLSQ